MDKGPGITEYFHKKGRSLKWFEDLQVKINGTELEVASKSKYLGVLLDNSLGRKIKSGLCL